MNHTKVFLTLPLAIVFAILQGSNLLDNIRSITKKVSKIGGFVWSKISCKS